VGGSEAIRYEHVKGRRWIVSRQAYTPSLWWALPIALAVGAVAWVVGPPVWVGALAGLVVGLVSARIQWSLWRRRHPVLPYEEVARRSAEWN
jgi:hypothetical protein